MALAKRERSYRIEESDLYELNYYADINNVSVSHLVRLAISEFLKRLEKGLDISDC